MIQPSAAKELLQTTTSARKFMSFHQFPLAFSDHHTLIPATARASRPSSHNLRAFQGARLLQEWTSKV